GSDCWLEAQQTQIRMGFGHKVMKQGQSVPVTLGKRGPWMTANRSSMRYVCHPRDEMNMSIRHVRASHRRDHRDGWRLLIALETQESGMAHEIIIYCDESDISGPHFGNFYGGLLVESIHLEEVQSRISESRAALRLYAEVKWQ